MHAVDLAGGTEVLHGKVEFIRFTRAGEIDRRIFGLNSDAPQGLPQPCSDGGGCDSCS